MKKIPAILLAAICGVVIEPALCVIAVVFVLAGGFGPCGPSGDVPGFIKVIHQPGFWLSGLLVEDSTPSYLLLSVMITTVLLSIAAFIILGFAGGKIQTHQIDGGG